MPAVVSQALRSANTKKRVVIGLMLFAPSIFSYTSADPESVNKPLRQWRNPKSNSKATTALTQNSSRSVVVRNGFIDLKDLVGAYVGEFLENAAGPTNFDGLRHCVRA